MAWRFNNLTTLTGQRAFGGLAAHANPYDVNANGPTKHVFFLGRGDDGFGDGHIHELWFDDGWHQNDLTSKTGAPLTEFDPSSYMFRGEGTQHVIYGGLEPENIGQINELWWDGDWHHNELTSAAYNAPPAFPGSAFGYEYSFGGSISPRSISQHVVYAGFDNEIHLLSWDPVNGWQPAAVVGPPPASAPTAYVFTVQNQASQRLLYWGDPQHVYELVWNEWGPNNRSWQANDLTVLSGAPLPNSRPVGLMHDLEFTLHVFYVSKDHLYELWWNNLGWNVNDLTALTSAPAPAAGAVSLAYVHLRQGTLNVNYVGVDRHIHRLWRDEGNEWNPANKDDLTIAAGGAPLAFSNPVGFPFFQSSGHLTQHIFYVADTSQDVIELTDGNRFE